MCELIVAICSDFMLGAFIIGLLLTGHCAGRIALGSHRLSYWAECSIGVAVAGLIGAVALDVMGSFERGPDSDLRPLTGLVTFGFAFAYLWLLGRVLRLRMPARELARQPVIWLLLLFSACATAWAGYRHCDVLRPAVEEMTSDPQPRSRRDSSFVALSDRGREIPLYVLDPTSNHQPAGWQPVTQGFRKLAQSIIPKAGPSACTNCHGWVFADGRFLLDGTSVQMILEDNGYQPVANPRSGDVIVYRDRAGLIRHSGMVSGILADGSVMIESKWNLQERFLHRPEDQPYATDYTYYRSPRGKHGLTIQRREAPPVAENIGRSNSSSDSQG